MTPNTVPSTFLWHRLYNTDHRTFSLFSLCLLTVSRGMRSFDKSKSPQETCKTEIGPHIVGTLVNPVLSCVTLKNSEVFLEVWIVNSDLVELLGLIICVETGLAPAELRMSCASWTGKFGKKVVDVKVGIDLEMTVKEQQRRVRHESGEGEMERYDTHVQQPFWHDLSHACMCTRMKMCKCDCARAMCRKMCVQQVSGCTLWTLLADQSFVDVCLPTLDSHSKPVLSCSLYAQASTVGNVPPMFWVPPEPDWFFGFDQDSMLNWLSYRSANKQLPHLGSGSGSDDDLHSWRSCRHLSLSSLSSFSCLLCQSCPPSGSEVLFVAAVLNAEFISAGFNVGLDFTSTCSYVISRARFMARCCSNSLGTRVSSAAVLMSSSRAVVVVPLDLLHSYRRTSSSHFSSPAGRSCSLHRSGTKICRKKSSALSSTQRIPTTDQSSQRLQTWWCRSKNNIEAFTFCQRQKCNMNLFALLLHIFNWFCTYRTALNDMAPTQWYIPERRHDSDRDGYSRLKECFARCTSALRQCASANTFTPILRDAEAGPTQANESPKTTKDSHNYPHVLPTQKTLLSLCSWWILQAVVVPATLSPHNRTAWQPRTQVAKLQW